MRRLDPSVILAGSLCIAMLGGCQDSDSAPTELPAGNPQRGKTLIRDYGCGGCHVIPGVIGAQGLVGPSLERVSRRGYLAGVLPNSRHNMVEWLLDPQAIAPLSAMPDVGLSRGEATDITAYLQTLD